MGEWILWDSGFGLVGLLIVLWRAGIRSLDDLFLIGYLIFRVLRLNFMVQKHEHFIHFLDLDRSLQMEIR